MDVTVENNEGCASQNDLISLYEAPPPISDCHGNSILYQTP